MEEASPVFTWPVRVYWEDTDAGGVVYYAGYLRFMERARTEWLRARGVEQDVLMANEGIVFAVVSARVEYRRPARFNDRLCVTAALAGSTRTTVTFVQEVRRDDAGGELLCEGEVRAACIDAGSFRPRAIPRTLAMEIGL